MIVRGTTPYHYFVLPISSADISEIYITYMQNGQFLFEKDKDEITLMDVDLSDNASMGDENEESEYEVYCQASVHLTQEDTLKFKFFPAAEKNIAWIQIRVLDTEGEAYAAEPVRERVYGILKNGVIPGEQNVISG